ncbi:MAG: VWA domain-containing protein [Deltaproteobacteria bacterium]
MPLLLPGCKGATLARIGDRDTTGHLLFGDFFYGLRKEGLKVGLSEWMVLLEALEQGAIEPSLDDFYHVARAILVKSEAHYDTYDQVFLHVFGGQKLPVKVLAELLEWLTDPKMREITAEMLEKLQALPLDELRRMFEERMREQDERHDGGDRWIGTGGTSPFGHGGQNPAGVRVAGGGGQRSAIQVATAREFKKYRHDQVLDVRSMAVALKKLRRISRRHADLELDIDKTIDETCRQAGELSIELRPPRKNEARVLLLMDVGGSMDPYSHMVERLFSAANSLHHWRKFEAFSFHNCVYERLEPGRDEPGEEGIMTADLLVERPPETFLILVGDAYMAPSELLDPWGAIHYYHHNKTPGIAWLHRLRKRFPRAVWLNPIRERGWGGWTIKIIREVFPMYPLTVQGLDDAISQLVKGAPDPIPTLAQLHPELAQFEYGE